MRYSYIYYLNNYLICYFPLLTYEYTRIKCQFKRLKFKITAVITLSLIKHTF